MNRKYPIFWGGLSILCWLLSAPPGAICQGNTWAGESLQKMVEAARWRLGPLRVNASLQANNAGYDSDVFYGFFNDPARDLTFSAGAPVQLLLPVGKKVVFDIYDSPQYLFYLETKNERAWNNAFRGQVHFALDRLYVRAGGSLANIRQRLSPELNINIRQKESGLNGLVLWQISSEASLAFLYNGARHDYGDAVYGGTPLAEVLNRKENYFDFFTYLQPNSRLRFFLDGQYGTYVFSEEGSGSRDTRSYGVFGGLEFIPREREERTVAGIQGRISLGYKRFDIISPDFVDGSGFVGAVSVSAGLLEKTSARAFLSRDFQFSVYSNATFYTLTAYGGGIKRFLSRKAAVSYDILFGQSSYPEGGLGGDGTPQGLYNLYTTHSFGLNIKLARHLEITFLGNLGRRTLDEASVAHNRNFFGINLIYGVAPGQMLVPLSGLAR